MVSSAERVLGAVEMTPDGAFLNDEQSEAGVFFEIPAFFYLLWWFVTQITSGTTALGIADPSGGVAWWAHIGGFIAGALLFPFFLTFSSSSAVAATANKICRA